MRYDQQLKIAVISLLLSFNVILELLKTNKVNAAKDNYVEAGKFSD